MLFKTVSVVAFMVGVAVASPLDAAARNTLIPFDLAAVTAAFTNIQANIDKMIELTKAFDGDTEKMEGMMTASSDILAAINDGTAKIAASPTMGIADALGVLGPAGTMATKVDDIVAALLAKKDVFDKSSITPVVIQQLQDQRQASDKLAKAITANLPMPALLGVIAGPIAKQFTDKLEAGIKAFGAEPTPLTGAPPPPSSSGSGSSSGKAPKTPKSKGKGKGGKSSSGGSRYVSIDDLVI
jgi:hypothetical protein